jgi:pimeloyl-ACP methyl ester carboxylesterase
LFLKRTIKTSGLLIVPKTGHTINLEEPALFNHHLSEFYASINASKWNQRDKRAGIVKL